MSTRLLLLAYEFPPENTSGAARPFRFYRYLPEFGISPFVITASPQDSEQSDILFVRDEARDFPRKNVAWHLERVVRKLFLPGEFGLTWSRRAAIEGSGQAPKRTSAVLSTYPPLAAHLAAFHLKRKQGIPWIADFRDPINIKESGEVPESRMSIYAMLESFFLRQADCIIVNTDAVLDAWSDRYPAQREKFHVIWNGFDPSETVSPAPITPRSYKHLVHVGEIYQGRNPSIILDSIQRSLARGIFEPGRLRLSLIGPSSDEAIPNIDVLHRLVEDGVVEYLPRRIPQRDARAIAWGADALVLLQPQSDIQVPAKLFEYIRIGRPILALIRRNSPIERILSRSGIPYRSIYPDDPPQKVDEKLIDFLGVPSDPIVPSNWFTEKFNARYQAQELATLVDSLTP